MQFPRLFVGDLDHSHAEVAEDVQVEPRVTANVSHGSDDEDSRVDAALHQSSGDDEAVAAVVAAATQHGDPPVEQRFVGRLDG